MKKTFTTFGIIKGVKAEIYKLRERDEGEIYNLVDPNGRYRYKIGRIILLKENDFSIDFVQSYKHKEDTWRL